MTQKHNLSFSGAAADNRINYRSGQLPHQSGRASFRTLSTTVINLTGASQAQVSNWLNADLSMGYTYANNDQSFKGVGGPLHRPDGLAADG